MALHQSISLSVHSSAQLGLRLQPVSSLNSSRQMYVSDYLMSYLRLRNLSKKLHTRDDGRMRLHARANDESRVNCQALAWTESGDHIPVTPRELSPCALG
jgi:hypothetical protein